MKWNRKPSPKELGKSKNGGGWFGELDRVWVDTKKRYCVMTRTIETEWGTIEHICMRNTTNTDIPWVKKQQIKNELFGEERVAIEVFPATSELVDEANMYHIWVLPKGFKMPFTLKGDEGCLK